MKPIIVLYATREGHTCRIAERVADAIHAQGFDVLIRNVGDNASPARLETYAGAILAASVHGGKHEPEMVKFVKEHVRELESMPAAFLSVSLSQAGVERTNATEDERNRFLGDVQKVLSRFFEETHWHPQNVKPVAGALLYRKYNFLLRWVMKRISQKSGGSTDTSRNHDYTDWVGLERFAREFARGLAPVESNYAHSR